MMRTFIFIAVAIFAVITVLVLGVGSFSAEDDTQNSIVPAEESSPGVPVPENPVTQTE